jgi:hypothetical protein
MKLDIGSKCVERLYTQGLDFSEHELHSLHVLLIFVDIILSLAL